MRVRGCLIKRSKPRGPIVSLTHAQPIANGTGKDNLIYFCILIVCECSNYDGIQLRLHLMVAAMRVQIVGSNRRPFLFWKSCKSVSDDRQLDQMVSVEVCMRKDLSSIMVFQFGDCFDTLIKFFTCLLHNQAEKQRLINRNKK